MRQLKGIFMRRYVFMLAAVSTIAVSTPALAVSNFFTDFDSVSVTPGNYIIVPTLEGWTATSGPGIEIQNSAAGAPFSSPNLVELDSDRNSEMSRSIDAGVYTLSYWFSPRPNQPAGTNGIRYTIDGVTTGSVTGIGGSNTAWALQTVNFTAFAPTMLRFSAIGTSDSLGGYVDSIRLVGAPVPEASTWAMLVLGFGTAGAAMRRRRRMTASHA